MKRLFLGIYVFSSMVFAQNITNNPAISSTIPNKPYFIKQCSVQPNISTNYLVQPLKFVPIDFHSPNWGQYKHHPLNISSLFLSAKSKANVFTKYNSPDYCSYATSIDIIIEIQPIIFTTSQLNNGFFTCINKKLQERETEYMKNYLSLFYRDKYILDSYLKRLEKEIFALYSTTNQSEFYNNSLGNKIKNVLNQFNLAKEAEFITLNNSLNLQRDYFKFTDCKDEQNYLEQFFQKASK